MHEVTFIEELYLKAVQILDPIQRAAYLDAACANEPDLRRKVEELLNAHANVGKFLEPQPQSTQVYSPHGQPPTNEGVLIGNRYKLLEKIGEGGMGEVWVADQAEPIKRRVALKLIKPGMDSRSVLARFEAERQALAVMDHPNIAKVLDAGTTGDGRPYFVMELVKGTPITEFADARKLTPTERLELFVPVCQAIQHAHMKGIIHRDIKPSNVLVELHDDRLVPKVIDFGVAKAVGQQLTEKTIYTGFGALVGTPTYMAPEQATFNAIDIDTRADVYALGVVLYELLAGSPPIESERLKKAALDEVLRIVRDEEPPRPSQRLSTSRTKASIAVTRGGEPMKLSEMMRGELDWIVMKALEKDRSRRYESANGFAADIQRYLAGEQVQAVPPSLGYRLKKAYRRNRAAVLVATAFTVLIVGAAVVSGLSAIQARRAEALAEAKRFEAEEQRKKAEENGDAFFKANGAYLNLAMEAEIRGNSARLDADLLEIKSDARVGLLRLARPLKDFVGPLPLIAPGVADDTGTTTYRPSLEDVPELQKLREFQAAAVIFAGQRFVPLVPALDELEHSRKPTYTSVQNANHAIIGSESQGLQLVAFSSLKSIAVLREATERLTKWGFSPDGQTAWTQDTDSVIRFWNTDGTLRAKTPLRLERFVYPAGLSLKEARKIADYANPIFMSDGIVVVWSQAPVPGADSIFRRNLNNGLQPAGPVNYLQPATPKDIFSNSEGVLFQRRYIDNYLQPAGPMDLYSTRTGQLIRRLDRPGRTIAPPQHSPDGRWLIFTEYTAKSADVRGELPPQKVDWELVIVSTTDGREVHRLKHPAKPPTEYQEINFSVSQSGKWLIVNDQSDWAIGGIDQDGPPINAILWRTSDWIQIDDTALNEALKLTVGLTTLKFITDEVLGFSFDGKIESTVRIGKPGSWQKLPDPVLSQSGMSPDYELNGELGGTLMRRARQLFTTNPVQRIKPSPGRKYASELAKISLDGRFFEDLDTVTEKELPRENGDLIFPGTGQISLQESRSKVLEGIEYCRYNELQFHIPPDPKRLNFPADMLELWAKVIVGGELDEADVFQPWDLPTWATKQQELAAMKQPYADFPFPGWAATEPNLWYRIRATEVDLGKDPRIPYFQEWQSRTGRRRFLREDDDTWRTPGPVPLTEESQSTFSGDSSASDAPKSQP
ncbi:MAG: serine/threonine-protein kinase [Planctomycetota bacterium]|nr:serine/threonine-protein kinase [Planctomycetota bacterium]